MLVRFLPVSVATFRHASLPPVGLVELSTSPLLSTAKHACEEGQLTPWSSPVEENGG